MEIKKCKYRLRCEMGACGKRAEFTIHPARVGIRSSVHICAECLAAISAESKKLLAGALAAGTLGSEDVALAAGALGTGGDALAAGASAAGTLGSDGDALAAGALGSEGVALATGGIAARRISRRGSKGGAAGAQVSGGKEVTA